MVAALRDDDNLRYEDAEVEVEVTRSTVPPSLQSTLLRRVGPLSHEVRDVLRVAAVLGSPFVLDDLAVVLAKPASQLLGALDEPMRARLIVMAGDQLEFRHDLLRDAVYQDLPAAARAALHVQAARRLAAAGRGVAQVATHFQLGAAPGDAEAVHWLLRAAREAVSRSPQVGVELMDKALHIGGELSALRDTLEAELGVALMWSGRIADGETRLRDLLNRPHDYEVDAPARLALGQTLLMQGHADTAAELLEDTRGSPGGVQRPQVLAEAALARLVRGELDVAARDAEHAREAGRQLGDDPAVCLALCVESVVVGLRGYTRQALQLAERALQIATRSPARETGRRPVQFFLGMLLLDLDRPHEGRRMLATARRVSENLGMMWDLPLYHLLNGIGHYHHGDLDDAAAEAQTSVALNDEAGTHLNAVWAQAVLALVHLQRGNLPAARHAIDAGEQMVAEIGTQIRGTDWLIWARGLYEECTGNTDTALAILWALWHGHAALGVTSERRNLGPDLIRLCLHAGDIDGARHVADAVAHAAQLHDTASAHAVALRCRGLAHDNPDLLLESVDLYRGTPRRMEHAWTCEEAGVALARAGRHDHARTLLDQALTIYQTRDAHRLARRAIAALRAAGRRPGATGPRRRPATGWDALTRTELEVSKLAAEGLTNPEIGNRLFISRRTVETHLSHVFGKLGVSSRIELAAEAARRSA